MISYIILWNVILYHHILSSIQHYHTSKYIDIYIYIYMGMDQYLLIPFLGG